MQAFFKVLSKVLNFTGISSIYIDKNDNLKISNWICAINLIKQELLLILAIYMLIYIDITIFLNDDQKLSDFTPFSLAIFYIAGQVPIIGSNFFVLSHYFKRQRIKSFLQDLIKIYKNINHDFKNSFYFINSEFYLWIVFFLLAFPITNFILLMKLNMWVIIAFSARFYYDLVVNSYFFTYIIFIKYMIFSVEYLKYRLEISVPGSEHVFDEIFEIYIRIYKAMVNFNKIYQLQISFFITYMIVRSIIMV